MSGTRGAVRLGVRKIIGDLKDGAFVVESDRINHFIERCTQYVGARLGMGQRNLALAITSNASGDYVLPSAGVEYQHVFTVTRRSDGWVLGKRTWRDLEDSWGSLAGVAPTGPPEEYSLRETEAQVVTIRTRPVTVVNDTLDIAYSQLPDSLETDASVIPFSRLGLTALELEVASTVISGLSQAGLDRLGLDRSFAQRCREDARSSIITERDRMAMIDRSANVSIQSW